VVIVAAGLTPAWQHILTFAAFRPGGVHRAESATWCASGKVLNVGSALHHLKARSRTISFYGGETGRLLRNDIDRRGISTRWVETSVPTRVCTTILDRSTGTTTELVENSSPVSLEELDRFADAFAHEASSAEWVILAGSLPQNTPTDFYRRLMQATSARVILDARGEELRTCLPLRPFLVKPNREELSATVNRPLQTERDLLAAMEELRHGGAERVVVSHGAQELWLLNADGLHRFQPPAVETVNPIGCGDCLAAGMVVAWSEGASDADAVRFGMAAAAENARHLLPARLERPRVDASIDRVPFRSPGVPFPRSNGP
jgi:1-phosphofructokinase family hexose kinase